jgi:purine-binding chemotaxis protein CheW
LIETGRTGVSVAMTDLRQVGRIRGKFDWSPWLFVESSPVNSASEPRSSASAASGGPIAQHQFVGFVLDETEYAIPIMTIREIILMRPITRIPQVPGYIEGLVNLRGLVIPIVNLRKRFELPARGFDEDTRTIVTTLGEKTVGCVVDSVSQVMRIPQSEIQPAPASVAAIARRFISGLARHEGRLLILLNLESLLESDDLDLTEAADAAARTHTRPQHE